ncbi:MAG TPA: serine acetyltransferase, partial [Erysipelotrichaceae bacterium]|nr:serine acetyltransferase [Erysipelotrichaceae bacterium]
MDNKISAIVNDILIDYQDDRTINKVNLFVQPDTAIVEDMLATLIKIIFPGFFNERRYRF